MSNFVPEKMFLRGVLLHYFNIKKTFAESHRILVEVYGEHAIAERTSQNWVPHKLKPRDVERRFCMSKMLLDRHKKSRIWKTVDEKFYPTRLIAQTLSLLTTISSGRCRTPSLEYGSHQNRVSKIGLIHSWPPSRRSSFGMESTNCQKDGKKS